MSHITWLMAHKADAVASINRWTSRLKDPKADKKLCHKARMELVRHVRWLNSRLRYWLATRDCA